jgi:hypothetical protein
MIIIYKDWHEMFSYAFLVYRTTYTTFTGVTPYLVCGINAVMLLEVEISSLRILMDAKLEESELTKLKFE